MATRKMTKQNVVDAIKWIDKNGVPGHNVSTKYLLAAENGRNYPPKYVIAVADHLATGADLSAESVSSKDARKYLQSLGFSIETKQQEKFVLTITADCIQSTDERFTMDNLNSGDHYRPLDAYFKRSNGNIVRRSYGGREQKISNQTLPRLACQVFEQQLADLPDEEKANFPTCKYSANRSMIRGIFSNISDYQKQRNSFEYLTYKGDNGHLFVIYSWNIFSTVIFVQECLKRFGAPGDQFVLVYREKDEEEPAAKSNMNSKQEQVQPGVRIALSSILLDSKNLILRGAPGTGKTYLAKQIAADIVSNGYCADCSLLTDAQKQQIEFVQFHPSYDYSDFVEGLRPKLNGDGTMGFVLRDGIFKTFVEKARTNWEDAQKPAETLEKESSVQDALNTFFSEIEFGADTFQTVTGNPFMITDADEQHISVFAPNNPLLKNITLSMEELRATLASDVEFTKVKDMANFFGKANGTQAYSYEFALYQEIKSRIVKHTKVNAKQVERKNYVFIIDEINRGEISKIFGELFFSIDPGYRGKAGEISTQYASLHPDPAKKFYIPENVYLIGTMNDIDRSVDSFDFAMRRRFRFVELRAEDHLEMLASLENKELEAEAIRRMTALNQEIVNIEDLNRNYQIGAAYFLKLKTMTFDRLWTDHLQPLLEEYLRGMYDETGLMERLAKAYGYPESTRGDANAADQDQG